MSHMLTRTVPRAIRIFQLAGAGLLLAHAAPCRAQDSVLVGDYNGSRIVKFAYPSGTPQSHFVGTGMTGLSLTRGMTFGPDGDLYIASDANDTVFRVRGQTGEPVGPFVTAASGGLNQPMGLVFGPDQRLYVSSFLTNSINVYNGVTGSFIDAFVPAASGTLAGPYGLAFNGGNLYVCSYNNAKVLRYNGTTGAFIDEAITSAQAGLTQPRGVVFDGGGRMYVTSGSNSVIVKDPTTGVAVLCSISTIPGLNNPGLLNLTANGNLIVPCYGTGTVQRIDRLTGSSLGTLVQNGSGGLASSLSVLYMPATVPCYANCDGSIVAPILNVSDFTCFLNRFASGCP